MKKLISILIIIMMLSTSIVTVAFADVGSDEQVSETTPLLESVASVIENAVASETVEQETETVPEPTVIPNDTPVPTTTPEQESTPEPSVTPETPPTNTPVNTPSTPTTDTPVTTPPSEETPVNGATRLQIDDANVYEGMDKAYNDGYLPQVKNGVVTLVLPLIADGDIKANQIVVTPNLGDSYSSPIQYKNYQKTFVLDEHLVNEQKNEETDVEERVEAYLVCFEFPLKSDRKNGTYPVSLSIQAQSASGNIIQQTYTCYFTVTDGVSTDVVTEPEISVGMTMEEETPESQPRILISKYSIDAVPVSAGEEFTATVTLRNTSETMAVQNMVVTVSCDSANFVLLNDSNTIYIDKLGAGKTMDVEIRYKTDLETPPQRYNVNLSMSYDNSDAMSLVSSGSIMVEVAQVPDVELAPFNLEPEVNAGETIQMSFQVMNLGRSPIYNARVELSAPGLYPAGTGFIGNMEPGTAATTRLDVFIGMKEDVEERYGATSGTVTLVYEDVSGQEYTQEVDIDTEIKALVISAPTTETEEEAESKAASQWWISVLAGSAVIGILAIVLRKQKKQKSRHIKL